MNGYSKKKFYKTMGESESEWSEKSDTEGHGRFQRSEKGRCRRKRAGSGVAQEETGLALLFSTYSHRVFLSIFRWQAPFCLYSHTPCLL